MVVYNNYFKECFGIKLPREVAYQPCHVFFLIAHGYDDTYMYISDVAHGMNRYTVPGAPVVIYQETVNEQADQEYQ
jgi:hypothetical protein